eukprot:825290-Prorocentrum_minimum.AAC.2
MPKRSETRALAHARAAASHCHRPSDVALADLASRFPGSASKFCRYPGIYPVAGPVAAPQ